MARTTSYAAEILQRDPEAREFNFGLLLLVLLLICSRIPFIFSATSGDHSREVINMLADGSAIASGETFVVAKPERPRLDAYVVALPLAVWRFVSYNHLSAKDFQALVARQSREVTIVLGFFALLIWLAVSFVLFLILRQKIDETVARFALWMMIWSPAGMVSIGSIWPAILVTPLVLFVLLCCATTVQRADTKVYLGVGVAIAFATGFGYHHILLFIPFLYAHFFTQRMPREHFLGLVIYPRLIASFVIFLLFFVAIHPQIWPIAHQLKGVKDLASLKGVFAQFFEAAPRLLFIDNGLERQQLWLNGKPTLWNMLSDFSSLLGSLTTLLAFIAAFTTLFRQDQRPWRPMTIYVFIVIVSRFVSPLPGLGWSLALAPPLVFLLAVNIMPIVARIGYRRERVVYIAFGLILSLQPGYLLYNQVKSFGSRSTADLARMELTAAGYKQSDVYHLAVMVHGERGTTRNPSLLPGAISTDEAYSLWARRLPSVNKLRKKGYRFVLLSLTTLRRLQKLAQGEDAARVARVISQFENLREVRHFSSKSDGSVIGEEIELLTLAR